jgi:diketogulonate reductase-like aldo/keto reductase
MNSDPSPSPLDHSCFDSPLTEQPGGPVDRPVSEIASRLNVSTDQVLLAWVKAKGAVSVT